MKGMKKYKVLIVVVILTVLSGCNQGRFFANVNDTGLGSDVQMEFDNDFTIDELTDGSFLENLDIFVDEGSIIEIEQDMPTEILEDVISDPCEGITCTGHGRCIIETGPVCVCDPGYHSSGLNCIPDETCDGVTCSGHGTCYINAGEAMCRCDDGFHAEGLSCVSDSGSPCDGVTCSGHGTCHVIPIVERAECNCDPGYIPYGLSCVEESILGCRGSDGVFYPRGTRRCGTDDTIIEVCRDANGDGRMEWAFGANCVNGTTCSGGCLNAPCNVQPCPLETSCIQTVHGEDAWICVVTCDCSNCGNCDMQDFVDCGGCWTLYCGSPGDPPTTLCSKPCPSPGEGCIPYTPPICWPGEGCMSGPFP